MKAKFVYEAFKEDSDPIEDTEIGIMSKLKNTLRQIMIDYEIYSNIDKIETSEYEGYSFKHKDDVGRSAYFGIFYKDGNELMVMYENNEYPDYIEANCDTLEDAEEILEDILDTYFS